MFYSSQMDPLITARMSLTMGLSAPVISDIWVHLLIFLCLLLKVMSHMTHKVIPGHPAPSNYLYSETNLAAVLKMCSASRCPSDNWASESTKSFSFLLSLI